MKTLIVEDDLISARVLASALQSYGPVAYATSPVEAYELYCDALDRAQPFDLICLDLELPKYDGLKFLDEIRRSEEKRGIPLQTGTKVLITTGHSAPATLFDATSAGCDGFLTKPLDRNRLVAELARLELDTRSK